MFLLPSSTALRQAKLIVRLAQPTSKGEMKVSIKVELKAIKLHSLESPLIARSEAMLPSLLHVSYARVMASKWKKVSCVPSGEFTAVGRSLNENESIEGTFFCGSFYEVC